MFEAIVNALIHRDSQDIGSEIHIDIYDDRLEILSPGGMCDGTLVQELDLERVPSRRRNPVLADVFARLNLMERRGSGFRKILADHHKATLFRPSLKPKLISTPTAFHAILYNLNYGLARESNAAAGDFPLAPFDGFGRSDGTEIVAFEGSDGAAGQKK